MTRLLVTGAGRSGTRWVAQCLREAGVPATHEHVFSPRSDGSGLDWEAEVSWPAAAYLPVDDAHVVHLVRHPLEVIASLSVRDTFSDRPNPWGRWAMERAPAIRAGVTTVERAALYWAAWNLMVEPHADRMLWLGGITPDDVTSIARTVWPNARADRLPPPTGTSAHPEMTWAGLSELVRPPAYSRVAELAERYGYR